MHVALKWVIFLVAVALVWVVAKYGFGSYAEMHPNDQTLDGKTWYWPTAVRPMLDRLNDVKFLPKYLEQESTVDLIFPLVYGLALIVPIVFLTTALNQPRLIALLAVLTVMADYTENLTVIALLKRYPGDLGWLPNLASVASAMKGTGLLACTGAIVILALTWIKRLVSP